MLRHIYVEAKPQAETDSQEDDCSRHSDWSTENQYCLLDCVQGAAIVCLFMKQNASVSMKE